MDSSTYQSMCQKTTTPNGSISSTVIFYKMSEVREVQIGKSRQKHNLKHDKYWSRKNKTVVQYYSVFQMTSPQPMGTFQSKDTISG